MKKYLLSLAAMLFMSFAVMSQITIYEDDFDSYNADDQLVLQNPINWVTWALGPGSSDDPFVVTEQASSNPNSVKITGTNDIVLLLGDQTAGKYNVMFKIYIPAGNQGYFNILHLFAGSNSEWGLQVYFDMGGIGIVDGDGGGAGAFTFNYDEWIDVLVNVNLDDDWCMFYINDDLVHEYQWSKGTFGNGTLNQLGGLNLYAWSDGAPPLYYVDDVVYELVTDVLIEEDFEAYNAGQKLVEQAQAQGLDYWATWSGPVGGAEDAFVSTDYSVSGSNSVQIAAGNDIVLLLDDKVTGAFAVEFQVLIPTGNIGYFNLLQVFAGAQSEWGMQTFFDQGGLGTVDAGGQGAGVFNYEYDTWIPVKVDVDLNADFAELFINGNSVVTWQWSGGTFGTGTINQLAAMNLYAWDQAGTPLAYYDDITFTQTAPAGGNPEIIVTPDVLSEELQVGETSTQSLTISNDGVVDLNYSILVSYVTTLDAAAGSNPGTAVEAPKSVASHISADEIAVVTGLNSTGAPENSDLEVILNYDGENTSAVGLTNGGTYEVAAKFPAVMVGQYIGMEMTEVQVFINDPANGYKIKIYGQDLPNRPGELLYEQLFSGVAGQWNTVTFFDPLVNSGGDLWVAYEIVQNVPGIFPAGTDAGPAHPDGDWIKTGASWAKLSDLNPALNYNWNIRAKLVGDPIQAWLTVDPGMGSIEPGQSEEITVNFSAAGLVAGTYEAMIKISSNDPVNSVVTVPVTLEVGGAAPLDPPTNLEAELVGADNVQLTWEAPGGGGGGTIEELIYDNGINTGAYSYNGFTMSTHMSPDGPCQVLAMKFYTTTQAGANDFNATMFEWAGSQPGTTIIYQENVTAVDNDWMEVDVSGQNINFSGDFVVGFGSVNGTTFLGYDGALNNGRSWDFNNATSQWDSWFEAYLIRAIVQYPDGRIAEIAPSGQTITPAVKTSNMTAHPANYQGVNPVKPIDKIAGSTRNLQGYNVYRDNEMINTSLVTTTEYLDEGLESATYEYYVTAVYDAGESGASNIAIIEVPVGIEEVSQKQFNVYPNPASGMINISGVTEINQVRIINYTGQVVYQLNTGGTEIRINTGNLASGVYLLQVETLEGWSGQKLIIR